MVKGEGQDHKLHVRLLHWRLVLLPQVERVSGGLADRGARAEGA
jgi:hypothetical protein